VRHRSASGATRRRRDRRWALRALEGLAAVSSPLKRAPTALQRRADDWWQQTGRRRCAEGRTPRMAASEDLANGLLSALGRVSTRQRRPEGVVQVLEVLQSTRSRPAAWVCPP
jgi:hypothetical protein